MSRKAAKIAVGDTFSILSDYVCKVPPTITSLDVDTNSQDFKERQQLMGEALERKPEALSTLKNIYGLTKIWDPVLEEVIEL